MAQNPLTTIKALAKIHRARFATFGVIGFAVFAMGLTLQALLVQVWHLGAELSYLAVGVVSQHETAGSGCCRR